MNTEMDLTILIPAYNVEKTPTLSRPYINLIPAYWNLVFCDKAYELYSTGRSLDRHTNLQE